MHVCPSLYANEDRFLHVDDPIQQIYLVYTYIWSLFSIKSRRVIENISVLIVSFVYTKKKKIFNGKINAR